MVRNDHPITLADLQPAGNPSCEPFRNSLESINGDPLRLTLLLMRWIEYNRGAGGLVAHFLSRLCFCDQLRSDTPLIANQDQGCQIATYPFRAIVEEFARISHRTLAQILLSSIIEAVDLDLGILNIETPHQATDTAIREFKKGYGFFRTGDDTEGLPYSFGWLLAGEFSAIHEFETVKNYMETNWPELTAQLRAAGAFTWIDSHAGDEGVEIEHFKSVLRGANEFIEYFGRAGAPETWKTREEILEGYAAFYVHNGNFLGSILVGRSAT